MKNFTLLLSLLCYSYAQAQISVGNATVTISDGTEFLVQGITFLPSGTMTLGNNVFQSSSDPVQLSGSVYSISHIITFSSPLEFTGTLRLPYAEADLNGNAESDLKLSYKTGGIWSSSNLGAVNSTENFIEETVTARTFEAITISTYYIPLPITLLSFTATLQTNAHIQLNWVTAEEMNNDRFTIERSTDGVHYTAIGTVPAANGPAAYTFTDQHPVNGTNFYRLRQHDHDGHQHLHGVKIVKTGGAPLTALAVPNTVTSGGFTLYLRHAIEKPLAYVIGNAAGQVVKTGRVIDPQQFISTGGLSPGVYMLRLSDGQTVRFRKL